VLVDAQLLLEGKMLLL